MTMSWTQFEPSRTVGRAITSAVRAAADADAVAYSQASAELTAVHPATSGLVLASVVRMLLEDQHAGGLDGDDIRAVLDGCRADTASWLPSASFSTAVLIAVLSSALGIHEPGVTYTEPLAPEATATEWVDPATGSEVAPGAAAGQRPPTDAEYAAHAPLLIASLLRSGGGRLDRYLDAAFADIARAETMELP